MNSKKKNLDGDKLDGDKLFSELECMLFQSLYEWEA